MQAALAIAATDPTSGAGLTADLKTLAAFGVYGLGAVTAITVQSRHGVTDLFPLPPALVREQIRAARSAAEPRAVKLGVVAGAQSVRCIAEGLMGCDAPLVLDPVFASTGGITLLDEAGRAALLEALVPRATLVTPNLSEASVWLGRAVTTRAEMEEAARLVLSRGALAVLVKGGHLAGDAADVLCIAGLAPRWLEAPRIAGVDLHGTGCALASATAACLARGQTLFDAVNAARAYVRALLEHGSALPGPGRALADHLGPLWARALRPQDDQG